jgi:hypothetical protein
MRPDIVFERSRRSIGRRSGRQGNEEEGGNDAVERGEQKMTEIIEFSCPYDYILRRRDSLKHVYEGKKRKYAELAKELKRQRGENVQVTAVIVSLIGAMYLPSLKDLQKVLRCSDEELRQLGRKIPETVIAGSMEIWRENVHRTGRGTNGEANGLIEIEIEEVERAEMATREEEERINGEEEWEMESEARPNEGRNQEEIDELLSDEREREREYFEDGREFGVEMRARTRADSDEMIENDIAVDSDVNGQMRRVQIPREPDEG